MLTVGVGRADALKLTMIAKPGVRTIGISDPWDRNLYYELEVDLEHSTRTIAPHPVRYVQHSPTPKESTDQILKRALVEREAAEHAARRAAARREREAKRAKELEEIEANQKRAAAEADRQRKAAKQLAETRQRMQAIQEAHKRVVAIRALNNRQVSKQKYPNLNRVYNVQNRIKDTLGYESYLDQKDVLNNLTIEEVNELSKSLSIQELTSVLSLPQFNDAFEAWSKYLKKKGGDNKLVPEEIRKRLTEETRQHGRLVRVPTKYGQALLGRAKPSLDLLTVKGKK